MIESIDNAHRQVGELHRLLDTVLHRLRQAQQLASEDPAAIMDAARVFSDVVHLCQKLPMLSVQVHTLGMAWRRAYIQRDPQVECR